jgi:glycogen operon protein
MRDYWRGSESMLGEFALRFTGSPDLYEDNNRQPTASINFVTAHDGFTLRDLVSYNEKHNLENGEDNNDGESHNRSWNCGFEGDVDVPAITLLRNQQMRNFLTTLFLSQGVPMIVAGDELGRTQRGNNNAYCQDNEISWVDWESADHDLLTFSKKIIHFCRRHPVFNRRKWFKGQPYKGVGVEDIAWFRPDGHEMNEDNWRDDYAKTLGIFLNGKAIPSAGPKGERIVDDNFFLIFNAYHDTISFKLPPQKFGRKWLKILDTAQGYFEESGEALAAGKPIEIAGRCVVLLKEPTK